MELKLKNGFYLHRMKFFLTLNKIKNIRWVELDGQKYEKIFESTDCDVSCDYEDESNTLPPPLQRARYGHYSKCYPTSSTCLYCFKYFCPCCDEGSNSLYGQKCKNRRCLSFLNKCHPELFDIESYVKKTFVYTESKDFTLDDSVSFCPKEIYGY